MRLLTTICVAAIAVVFCMPAFAETQNVKVSGDIAIYHIYQHNLDLNKDDGTTADTAAVPGRSDSDTFFMQQIGLNVEADLTDNVSTYIRLINERDWDTSGATADFDIDLDEAYITLKEMLYAPLTLKLGRQNMWFGKGMIVGDSGMWDYDGTIAANELSDRKSFDALRATLDYDPWTVDLVYAKIDENAVNRQDDTDLYGVNIGYIFDRYEAEAEAYVWHKHDQSNKHTAAAGNADTNECTTMGLRGSLVPYENTNVWAEGAMQLGKEHDTTGAVTKKDREAWMLDVGGDYTFADVKWTPTLGLEYLYLSGDSADPTGDFEGWDPMYRGRTLSIIRDFMDNTYTTDAVDARGRSSGLTNQHQVRISGGLDLMEDLTLDGDFSMFWFDESILTTSADDEIGQELDGYLTYDYTEDVQFKVAGGIFWPDDAYEGRNSCDDTATKVVSSVKVEF